MHLSLLRFIVGKKCRFIHSIRILRFLFYIFLVGRARAHTHTLLGWVSLLWLLNRHLLITHLQHKPYKEHTPIYVSVKTHTHTHIPCLRSTHQFTFQLKKIDLYIYIHTHDQLILWCWPAAATMGGRCGNRGYQKLKAVWVEQRPCRLYAAAWTVPFRCSLGYP